MKKKRNPTVYLLFFLFLVGIAGIFFISYRTYQKINSFEKELLSISQQVTAQQEVLNQSKEIIDKAVQMLIPKRKAPKIPPPMLKLTILRQIQLNRLLKRKTRLNRHPHLSSVMQMTLLHLPMDILSV